MRKKKIVENDKAKISELIVELDQKKNEALQTAWQRVNQVSDKGNPRTTPSVCIARIAVYGIS